VNEWRKVVMNGSNSGVEAEAAVVPGLLARTECARPWCEMGAHPIESV